MEREDDESAHLLECAGLTRRFGDRTAVDGVSFHIARGETYGLLGPNGAGKTTMISMVAGILRADGGSVHLGSESVTTGACPAKGRIGLVPQDIALYEDLTARENLDFFGRLQGLSGSHLAERIDHVLGVVELTDRAGDRVGDYSGGMQRRANIAVGLLHEPELLVLDEPTVGVDPQSRHQILEAIDQLGGAGLSVLYTTHYMEEAERLCDRIGIVDAGSLIAEGTRDELVRLVGEHDRIELGCVGAVDGLTTALEAMEGVVEVAAHGSALTITLDDAARRLAQVIAAAQASGVAVESAEVARPDLEAVFLHLTGRALRD